jgi:hypothetical protein
MEHITPSQIQDLLNRLPVGKLPVAYSLLHGLLSDETGLNSPQVDFLRLPLTERRRKLAEQAQQMVAHYEQATAEREVWQAGGFVED